MNEVKFVSESLPISDKLLKSTKDVAADAAKKAKEVKVVLQTDLVQGEKPPKPDLFHSYSKYDAVTSNPLESSVNKLNEKAAEKAYSDIPPMPL